MGQKKRAQIKFKQGTKRKKRRDRLSKKGKTPTNTSAPVFMSASRQNNPPEA